jgi:hypothetical protein
LAADSTDAASIREHATELVALFPKLNRVRGEIC